MSGKCCSKYYVISSIAIAAYLWLYDFIVHGNLFVKYYLETLALWRPMDQMPAYAPYGLALHFAVAFLVTAGFFCYRSKITTGTVGFLKKDCPYYVSIRFGLWVGLLLGVTNAGAYIYLPIPVKIAIFWFGANVVKFTLAGILLAKLYRWKEKSSL